MDGIIAGVRHKSPFLFLILLAMLASACTPEPRQTAGEGAGSAAAATMPAEEARVATIPPSATSVKATTTALPGETADPEPTLAASETSGPQTVTPPPSPTSEPAAAQVVSGQTAEGAFFLGAPAAPLTLIDYSDFL